jgi:hypothetical protein
MNQQDTKKHKQNYSYENCSFKKKFVFRLRRDNSQKSKEEMETSIEEKTIAI